MKIVAVIMAGGKGERFWPRSRKNMPKQFLCLTNDDKTMIQHTVERLNSIVQIEDIFVVTNKDYKELVKQQLKDLPNENILLEPVAKNTAPCIGLAAVHIRKKYQDAIMLVLPSDHLIKYNELFIDTLKDAAHVAEKGENLVTIGITPTYPETGYGYINFGAREKEDEKSRAYCVDRFVEKPNLELAKEYLASGKYLWNSGMFVWKTSTILKKFQDLLPEVYDGMLEIENAIGKKEEQQIIETVFSKIPAESIDYGIMEHAKNIYTIPGNFGWDDVGSWLALERVNKTNENGNVIQGNVISINTNNTIVQGTDKLIATIGIENLIIVDTDDAMLICTKESTQEVKKVIENLKVCNRDDYL